MQEAKLRLLGLTLCTRWQEGLCGLGLGTLGKLLHLCEALFLQPCNGAHDLSPQKGP